MLRPPKKAVEGRREKSVRQSEPGVVGQLLDLLVTGGQVRRTLEGRGPREWVWRMGTDRKAELKEPGGALGHA